MTLRALIVDDEMLARRLLREYLRPHADIEVIGESENGEDALRQLDACGPDLVFLDIQMPRLSGLEVLELSGRRSGVIFTTAYDEHAIKAFELHAVDYLLKPFSQARFDAALARARQLQAVANAQALAADARGGPLQRLLIRDREQVQVIAVELIECLEAQGDYLGVHAQGRCQLKLQKISEIETQLDAKQFIRVHRSWIVNLAHVVAIERHGSEGHGARMAGGRLVPVSRSGLERLRQAM